MKSKKVISGLTAAAITAGSVIPAGALASPNSNYEKASEPDILISQVFDIGKTTPPANNMPDDVEDPAIVVSPIFDVVMDGFISGDRGVSGVELEEVDMMVTSVLFSQALEISATLNDKNNGFNVNIDGDLTPDNVSFMNKTWSTSKQTPSQGWQLLAREESQEILANEQSEPGDYYLHIRMSLTTGDMINFVSETPITIAEDNSLNEATEAVEKAETTKNPADIQDAWDKVNELPEGEDKDNLKDRLEKIEEEIEADNLLAEAIAAVEKAEETKMQIFVDLGYTAVNKLPDSEIKTELLERLDKVQVDIFYKDLEERATQAVIRAELSKSTQDIDSAYELVNQLEEGELKAELLDRLQAIKDEVEAERETLEKEATEAVEKAEDTKNQGDVDDARDKVDKLPEGPVKDDLTGRLDELQKEIDDEKPEDNSSSEAAEAVEKAEQTKNPEDIQDAWDKVNELPEGEDKDNLKDRLEKLEEEIEADNLLAEAIAAVEKAEETKMQIFVDLGYTAVNKLPDSEIKTELLERLDKVQVDIFYKDLEERATQAVIRAELSKSTQDIDSAYELVNQLEEGELKTELLDRLQAIKDEIEAENEILEKEATDAVEKAEDTKNQGDIDDARDKVDKLPEGPVKDDLTGRLDELQKEIDEKQKEIDEATDTVEKAEDTKNQGDIDDARDKVDKLPEGPVKDDLTGRLDELQKEIDEAKKNLDEATDAVEKAEQSKDPADIQDAWDKVNRLPEGQDKNDLKDRLEKLEKEIEAENLLAEAIEAVEKAEETVTQGDVNIARDKVSKLPNSEVKTELNNRLNVVQAKIDYEALVARAVAAVEKAESTENRFDITAAYSRVDVLNDGPVKAELTERLEALQAKIAKKAEEDRINNEAIKAVELAEATKRPSDINLAKDKVSLVKDLELKTQLEERLAALELAREEIANAQAIKQAENLVRLAEIFRRNPHVANAQSALNSLTASEEKLALEARLDKVLGGSGVITPEMRAEINAEQSVERAEQLKYRFLIISAKDAVSNLHEGAKKTELTQRINVLLSLLGEELL